MKAHPKQSTIIYLTSFSLLNSHIPLSGNGSHYLPQTVYLFLIPEHSESRKFLTC